MKTIYKADALDLTSLLNGLVFFAPVALLIRTTAGVSVSQFFLLQAILSAVTFLLELPGGRLTDRIGYKNTLVLYQLMLLLARACLLAAHVLCSWPLFVVQAVLEGAAYAFSSGTQSAYIYSMFPKERYAEKAAHVANFSTAGFFASTAAYALLYALTGIEGLLCATLAANIAAVFVSLRIPQEARAKSAANAKAGTAYRALFRQKRVWALFLALAALNIGGLLINFFYAEKLQQCGVSEAWLSPVIMGYSVIRLLAEQLLAHSPREKYPALLALFFVLSGAALGVLGLVKSLPWVLFFMLLLPFLLDVPSYLLGEVQNRIIDGAGREEKRAELLSFFNMGVSATELFFLLGSSLVAGAGSALCFVLLGVFMALAGLLLHIKKPALFSARC